MSDARIAELDVEGGQSSDTAVGSLADVSSFYADVVEFHRAFGVPVAPAVSGVLAPERLELRRRLLAEEYAELLEAMDGSDAAEIAKEGADLVVVTLGAMAEYGIPFDAVWAEVHRSNMAKLGPDGQPVRRADGKVLKPPGWRKPDIAAVIASALPSRAERRRVLSAQELRQIADLLDAGESAFRALERITGERAPVSGGTEMQDTLRSMAEDLDRLESAP